MQPQAAAPINRTGHAATRRAEGTEGNHTDTVASGPSASFENADGAESLPTTGAISRHARVTENVPHDSEVTAVPQGTRTPSCRDSGTPNAAHEAVTP